MLNSGSTSATSRVQKLVLQPLGGLLAFGLGVASFPVPALHQGLGTAFGVALIVAGLTAYHLTVNKSAA